ncbi:hypothetical protein LUZ60_012701 [Juncus effusus]|nr:hypothetical protein LUZ60_012701 [Juncus effusus]
MASAKLTVSWSQIVGAKLNNKYRIRATISSESTNTSSIAKNGNKRERNMNQLKKLDSYFDKLYYSTSNDVRNFGKERNEKDEIAIVDLNNPRNPDFVKSNSNLFVQFQNNTKSRTETLLYDQTNNAQDSDFCLINLLAGINIAVLLFEMASPIRNVDLEYISLPLFYGAKINKLILLGEWWRLLTPMFLHSGLLHVAVGCWALLTIGPKVCKAYGPITFFLIYLLGGLFGNFTSFLHTPELTVCGTGPVFGIIGAWLVYQVQNKEAVRKQVSENIFRTAVIITFLTFVLSGFGRIDNWTHIGAIFSGLLFGYFTCPSLEIDDSNSNLNSKNGKKEGFVLVQRRANPWKSFAIFIVSVILLSSIVVLYGMQIEMLEFE